jgi:hypothetical protein
MSATIKDLTERGLAIRAAQLAHTEAMRATAEQLGTARRQAAQQAAEGQPAPPEGQAG